MRTDTQRTGQDPARNALTGENLDPMTLKEWMGWALAMSAILIAALALSWDGHAGAKRQGAPEAGLCEIRQAASQGQTGERT